MNKIKIIALFGESASGKDTIQKYIIKHMVNTQSIISYTTRPKREYEKDGIDYHFIDDNQFKDNISQKKMLEYTKFRKWYYGTGIDSLSPTKINIGVFNIDGLNILLKDKRLRVAPIYIYAPDKIRLKRSLNREKNPDCAEICRRFLADKKDFEKINFPYLTYKNIKSEITIIEDTFIRVPELSSWL